LGNGALFWQPLLVFGDLEAGPHSAAPQPESEAESIGPVGRAIPNLP
jgi:hypothetical protein